LVEGLRELNGAVTLRDVLEGGIILEQVVIEAINKKRRGENKQVSRNKAQSIISKMKGNRG